MPIDPGPTEFMDDVAASSLCGIAPMQKFASYLRLVGARQSSAMHVRQQNPDLTDVKIAGTVRARTSRENPRWE